MLFSDYKRIISRLYFGNCSVIVRYSCIVLISFVKGKYRRKIFWERETGKAGRVERVGKNGGAEIINKFFLDFNIFFVLLPPSHKGCCNRLRLYP